MDLFKSTIADTWFFEAMGRMCIIHIFPSEKASVHISKDGGEICFPIESSQALQKVIKHVCETSHIKNELDIYAIDTNDVFSIDELEILLVLAVLSLLKKNEYLSYRQLFEGDTDMLRRLDTLISS